MRVPGAIDGRASRQVYGKNILANGDFMVAQRGTSFTSSTTTTPSDGNYLFDQWYILVQGTDPSTVERQVSTLGRAMRYAARLVAGGINSRTGLFQYLENEVVAPLQGETVSLSCQIAKSGVTLTTFKMAVFSTTASADTESRDIVGTWTGDISPGGNWSELVGTDVTITSAGEFVEVRIEGFQIPSNATNLVVGVYETDAATASGVEMFVGNIQLERGIRSTEFEAVPYGIEEMRCKRYLHVLDGTGTQARLAIATGVGTTAEAAVWFPVRMRAVPTLTKLGNANLTDIETFDGSSETQAVSAYPGSDTLHATYGQVRLTVASLTNNQSMMVWKRDGTAGDVYIIFSAEL